jgi:hypothetical protein
MYETIITIRRLTPPLHINAVSEFQIPIKPLSRSNIAKEKFANFVKNFLARHTLDLDSLEQVFS